jgi:acetolactate synthase I/III small subunit
VVKVVDLSGSDHVERELMLIKVRAEGPTRDEVKRTTDIFRGQIIDVTASTYTVQLSGPSDKLDAFIRAMRSFLCGARPRLPRDVRWCDFRR